jgi:acyl carrier protein
MKLGDTQCGSIAVRQHSVFGLPNQAPAQRFVERPRQTILAVAAYQTEEGKIANGRTIEEQRFHGRGAKVKRSRGERRFGKVYVYVFPLRGIRQPHIDFKPPKEMSEIADKVKSIIIEKLGVDESEVTPEASFTNDLGADSLDTVELIMEFEKEFNVSIPDDQAENIQTVGQAVSYLEEHAK